MLIPKLFWHEGYVVLRSILLCLILIKVRTLYVMIRGEYTNRTLTDQKVSIVCSTRLVAGRLLPN